MSQWTASQPQQSVRSAKAREPVRRAEPRAPAANLPAGRAGYTIMHGGRQVRFKPIAFWIAVGSFVIMAGWSLTTATYFAFSDDVLKGLIARQTAQQYAYEDRIAELRARVDRTTSRQLLDQEQFQQKLDELARRQAMLESRASALSGAGDPPTTGSIRPTSRSAAEPPARPSPIGDTPGVPSRVIPGRQSSIQTMLGHVEASLDRVEQRETAAVAQMEARYAGRARLLRGVLDGLGLKLATIPAATGGPFVPVRLPPESQSFERALARVSVARVQAEQLAGLLALLPLRKPVTGDIDISSPFGVRMDPIVHEAAMHTGIDFRGDYGEPIHATAAGTVSTAGWNGGYGQMVEINHGNGLATRYGHLSLIGVVVGQKVRAGEVIGRLGSTGRSTGPHVHYETRIDGEAVNPQRFLTAGEKLYGE
jgi:murein DD-endopeptidase MepM/ murein hydrolase activator NlpD